MEKQKWAIVGGGLMGMSLAKRLAQQGQEITILESGPQLGGLVSSWKMNDFEWDKFYHVILLSDFQTRKMLGEIGLEDQINWVETKTGFYTDKKLISLSNSFEFLKFPALGIWDKFRLALTIVYASRIKNGKRLEYIPVTEWLKKWSGSNTYNKIWLPLLRAKLGDAYQRTSAAFIWATIKRLYGARKSGLKKEMFGYVPGGYKPVILAYDQYLKSLGVTIKTGFQVTAIRKSESRHEIIDKNGNKAEYDRVIVTLPSGIAADICPELSAEEKQKLRNIQYLGVICVTLILEQQVSPFYVTNITDSQIPFTGIIEMTALVDKKYFDGKTLIYLPKYLNPDDPLFIKSDAEITEYFISNFKKMYPEIEDNQILFTGVAKAKHVITVLNKGYTENLPNVSTSIPGLYIINSAHISDGTLNVNETIKVAESKLEQVLNKQDN